MKFKLFVIFLGFVVLFTGNAFSKVIFEDNFETGKLDKAKWVGAAAWKVVDNDKKEPALGKYVLDVLGGEEGLGVDDFPEEFDYYADFRSMNGLSGFLFHGKDASNVYMHQISVTGSAYTPNNTRWHRKVAGTYTAEPEPFQNNVSKDQQVWYRVKFEVRTGYHFKAYLGDVGAAPKDLTLVGEWTDSAKSFKQGKIGFRMSGTEYAQYDNVVVTTPNYNFAVDPNGKLALKWGKIKIQD
jgi:hypothetical protein